MGRIRIALERFGRRLVTLVSRPRRPGPVADLDTASGSNGDTVAFAASAPDAAADESAPSFRNRARLRRRLRYLRQTRELGFRDLGGFMFDSKRFGRDRDDIVEAKLEGLVAIDRELRALEIALDDAQDVTLLREPGISVCPRCGALHGSEDNYCNSCGLPVGRGLGLAIAQGGPGGAAVAPGAAAPDDGSAAPGSNSNADAKPKAKPPRKSADAAPKADSSETSAASEAAATDADADSATSETPSASKP